MHTKSCILGGSVRVPSSGWVTDEARVGVGRGGQNTEIEPSDTPKELSSLCWEPAILVALKLSPAPKVTLGLL